MALAGAFGQGQMVQKNGKTYEIIQEQFYYNAVAANLASAGSTTASVNIQADADFIIAKQTRDVRLASSATLVPSPNGTVLLTDTGSGRQMSDVATAIENYFGTAQFPYILPQAKRLAANSTFQVLITNNGGAAWDVNITFSGFKQYIYDRGQA